MSRILTIILTTALSTSCLKSKSLGIGEESKSERKKPDASIGQRQPAPQPTLAPAPLATYAPPVMECYKADDFICAAEKAVWRMTNDHRTQQGKPPLQFSKEISFVSREWSRQQAEGGSGFFSWFTGGISHKGFPIQREEAYMREFGQSADLRRENVAMNGYGMSDPESVAAAFVKMWWGSSGHKRNMLATDVTLLGVGIYRKGSSSFYATQIFGR